MLQRGARSHAHSLTTLSAALARRTPNETTCSSCCCCCSSASASSSRPGSLQAPAPLRQVARPLGSRDWSLPSTSRIPYTPPAGVRSFASSSSRPSRLEPNNSDSLQRLEPELEHFLALETRQERLAARDAICRAISSATPTATTTTTLPRADFDSLWSRIAALEPAVSAAILKRLRDLALRSYNGDDDVSPLSHEQKRQIVAARSAQEHFETRLRTRRAPRGATEVGAQSGGKAKVLKGRRAYLDRCADEFFESVQSRRRRRFGPAAAAKEEEEDDPFEGTRDQEDARVLETYAQRLVERASSSSSSSAAETASSSFETTDRASQFLLLALTLRAPLVAAAVVVVEEEPVISALYSTPLPVLFAHDPVKAIRYLQAMLDQGRLPTPASIREIVRAYFRDPPGVARAETAAAGTNTLEEEEARRAPPPRDRGEEEEEEAVYARARQVLDEACSVGSSSSPFGRRTLRPPTTGDACSPEYEQQHPPRSDRLESLLQERLERVDRAEALAHEPTLYMIRWLGLLRLRHWRHQVVDDDDHPVGTTAPHQVAAIAIALEEEEERQAALECALSLWEVSQVRGRDEFQVGALQTSRSTVARLLEALVLEACELETEAAAAARSEGDGDGDGGGRQKKKRQASRAIEKAFELAGKYMQHQVLVHHSPRLLRAVTVSAHAPHLALALFDVLTDPPRRRPDSTTASSRRRRRRGAYHPPFTWTLDLLPTFVSLFLSSVAPAPAPAALIKGQDDSLPIRLYLSWTASGLSFPDGLWNELWRALGRRGSVEELARVVADWEETGRGQIAGRIGALVLSAAAAEPPVQSIRPAQSSTATTTTTAAPLRLLSYFRSRYIRPGESAPSPALLASSPYLVVPLAGYTAVLRSLARSRSDQRPAQRVVWRHLLRDGHAPDLAAYNALLAAHVWRPDPFFTVKDLDDAGVVYNQLIEAGRRGDAAALHPDRETFSLLVHGFLRIANSTRVGKRKREITLEAAHRTFTAAADRGSGLRGHQAARLVRTLAHSGRFEDAKVVQEKWWRTLVALESEWDRWRKSRGRRGKRGESMWDDEEIKGEMREMRMARDDAERIEARHGAVASVVASELPVEDTDVASDDAEVGIEEDDGAETAEAFATLPLGSVGSTAP